MAGTRRLVDEYLEQVSVSVFEKYQHEITDLVNSRHGVYALYKNERLYYVGLAQNLHRRTKQHQGIAQQSPERLCWGGTGLGVVRASRPS